MSVINYATGPTIHIRTTIVAVVMFIIYFTILTAHITWTTDRSTVECQVADYVRHNGSFFNGYTWGIAKDDGTRYNYISLLIRINGTEEHETVMESFPSKMTNTEIAKDIVARWGPKLDMLKRTITHCCVHTETKRLITMSPCVSDTYHFTTGWSWFTAAYVWPTIAVITSLILALLATVPIMRICGLF